MLGAALSLAVLGAAAEVGADDASAPPATLHRGLVPEESTATGAHAPSPSLMDQVELWPLLTMQTAGFADVNDGWGAPSARYGPVGDGWFELASEFGLHGQTHTRYGTFFGAVSGLFTMTAGSVDAAASNVDPRNPYTALIEQGYVGWRSGDLLPGLGKNALEISGGPQRYSVGSGFLIHQGSTNAHERGAYWIGARWAFRLSGFLRLHTGPYLAEGFYLQPHDAPFSNTNVLGTNLQYDTKPFSAGFTYMYFASSDIKERPGLDVFDVRAGVAPIPRVPDLRVDAEAALEENGDKISNAYGWYVSPSYKFSMLPWQPRLFYRYAFFSGTEPGSTSNHTYYPVFYGSTDWGTWYQGELLGQFASINSNLISHQVRVRATPDPALVVNLTYYHFATDALSPNTLYLAKKPGKMTSRDLGDEVDLILIWAVTGQLNLCVDYGVNVPGLGTRQISGGGQVWSQWMLYMSWVL